MRSFLIALQFLTIIPVRRRLTSTETEVAGSSSAFVIVGVLQGALLAAVYYGAGRIFRPDLATAAVLLVSVLYNGGFHLDGLGDTFDAIAAKGDRERRLSVMRDGSIGPIGVVAIFFALLLKYLALNDLALSSHSIFFSSLFLMPAVSKWAMIVSMCHGVSAREEGLGKIFINKVGGKELALSTLFLSFSFIASAAVLVYPLSAGPYFSFAAAVMVIYLLCRTSVLFFRRRFGGLTGDILGATGECSEIIFLVTVIAWSRLSIS